MTTAEDMTLPIFKLYTIEQLNSLTGYSEVYLLDIKRGRHQANARFRLVCTRILQRPEAVLFGDSNEV